MRELTRHATALSPFLTSNHRKNGPPINAVMTPTGSSSGDITVRADHVASDEERRTEERRSRQDQAVVGSDDQPHQMRGHDADEPDGSADRDRAPVASER
jgi:hypothetical protein